MSFSLLLLIYVNTFVRVNTYILQNGAFVVTLHRNKLYNNGKHANDKRSKR